MGGAGRKRSSLISSSAPRSGRLNGWAIAGGCNPAELSSRWLRLHDIGMHRWRMPPSLLDGFLDATRMHAWIRDLYASYEPRIAYGVVLTDVLRMKPRLFTSPGVSWEHLAGSCAIFGVLPQMRIQGRYYTDGGLLEALPLWAARQMGATDIIGINVLPRLPGSLIQMQPNEKKSHSVLLLHRPALAAQ